MVNHFVEVSKREIESGLWKLKLCTELGHPVGDWNALFQGQEGFIGFYLLVGVLRDQRLLSIHNCYNTLYDLP